MGRVVTEAGEIGVPRMPDRDPPGLGFLGVVLYDIIWGSVLVRDGVWWLCVW